MDFSKPLLGKAELDLTPYKCNFIYFLFSYRSFGYYGIWRCGDWRSKFRIINCFNPNNPVIDFPPGYDFEKLNREMNIYTRIPGTFLKFRLGGIFSNRGPSLRIWDVPIYGFPDVYRESENE